jgi:sulfate adenylyltransferase subunit 1 (EFTu-like GTPase family)
MKNSKVLLMKKAVILGILLLGIFCAYTWYSRTNSFEFKIEYIKCFHGERELATGKVVKGTLNVGDLVKIKRDGKTIKSARVHIITKLDKGRPRAIKSISKEDNLEEVSIGLEDIDVENISIGDVIIK